MIRTLVLYDESDLDEALEYLTESIEHESGQHRERRPTKSGSPQRPWTGEGRS